MRKVVPFMDPKYFEGVGQQLFKEFAKYVAKYNGIPSIDAFKVSLQESEETFSEEAFRHAMDILPDLFRKDADTDVDWLVHNTEKWCQDRALFNAVMESISIIDGKHKTLTKTHCLISCRRHLLLLLTPISVTITYRTLRVDMTSITLSRNVSPLTLII